VDNNEYSQLENITEQQLNYLKSITNLLEMDRKEREEQGKEERNTRNINAFITTQVKFLDGIKEILADHKLEFETKKQDEIAHLKAGQELENLKNKPIKKDEPKVIDLFSEPTEPPQTETQQEEPTAETILEQDEKEEGINNEENS
jgi:hypothetical protein